MTCPFLAGPMLTDGRYFSGRKQELNILVHAMTGGQPVSINVHGERRMGKSSLLYHFSTTLSARVVDHAKYGVIYVDLQNIPCANPAAFFNSCAHALQGVMNLPLAGHVDDYISFRVTLEHWKPQGKLPVLCLDGFEKLVQYADQYSHEFFENLRSLIDHGLLMMIIATATPMRDLKKQFHSTSTFFNNAQFLHLPLFSSQEITELLTRSCLNQPNSPPCLSEEEQKMARDWGGAFPYTLQLAAQCLCEARQGGSVERARQRFDQQILNIPSLGRWWAWRHLPVQGGISKLLAQIGRLVLGIGNLMSRLGEVTTGIVLLLLVLLLATGILPMETLLEWLKQHASK